MRTKLQGAGIGLRRKHFKEILETSRRIDWLEIIPENYMGYGGRPSRQIDECRERWAIAGHGVALSLAGPDPLDTDYLAKVEAISQRVEAPWFSEHLSFARVHGLQTHDLVPLPFNRDATRWVVSRIRRVQAALARPFLVENVSFYAVMPGSDMHELDFLAAVLEEADCGLMFDVNNLYVNSRNHGYDPFAALDRIPLHRARQIHLAGHRDEGDVIIDDHGSAVCEDVWALYRETIRRAGPIPTLIEWDANLPTLDRLLDEADRARAILEEAG
ncbi:MAG: DUF692 domain-containing protein [Deltaproteobacteria bacterium]|nr:DUF692 domain-containing protein [Deltaproteobacteria bacterium]